MNLLDFYFPEWFFVALNLVILIVVLQRIFWKPVMKILDERRALAEKTEADSETASALRLEAEQLKRKMETDIDALTSELTTNARSRAGVEYDRIISEAEAKAKLIIASAKTKAEQERDRAMVDMKNQIASVATDAAEYLMRLNMDGEANRRLIENYLTGRESAE